MNRDDIIRLAREAGIGVYTRMGQIRIGSAVSDCTFEVVRFAKLVAAAEREACAITCEQTTASWTQHLYNEGVMDCVKAIRARG